jgi:hypothetical protein
MTLSALGPRALALRSGAAEPRSAASLAHAEHRGYANTTA